MCYLKIYIRGYEVSCSAIAGLKAAMQYTNEKQFPDNYQVLFATIHQRGDEIYENTITLKNPI